MDPAPAIALLFDPAVDARRTVLEQGNTRSAVGEPIGVERHGDCIAVRAVVIGGPLREAVDPDEVGMAGTVVGQDLPGELMRGAVAPTLADGQGEAVERLLVGMLGCGGHGATHPYTRL